MRCGVTGVIKKLETLLRTEMLNHFRSSSLISLLVYVCHWKGCQIQTATGLKPVILMKEWFKKVGEALGGCTVCPHYPNFVWLTSSHQILVFVPSKNFHIGNGCKMNLVLIAHSFDSTLQKSMNRQVLALFLI